MYPVIVWQTGQTQTASINHSRSPRSPPRRPPHPPPPPPSDSDTCPSHRLTTALSRSVERSGGRSVGRSVERAVGRRPLWQPRLDTRASVEPRLCQRLVIRPGHTCAHPQRLQLMQYTCTSNGCVKTNASQRMGHETPGRIWKLSSCPLRTFNSFIHCQIVSAVVAHCAIGTRQGAAGGVVYRRQSVTCPASVYARAVLAYFAPSPLLRPC